MVDYGGRGSDGGGGMMVIIDYHELTNKEK